MLHSLQATAARAVLLAIPLLGAWTLSVHAQTAYQVKDINTTDDQSIGLSPIGLARAGQKAFFLGWDAANGRELWVSDGTSADTKIVTDIQPGPFSAFQNEYYSPLDVNGTLFFNVGHDLWKSDGTAAGTSKVKTVGDVRSVAALGGVLYLATFSAISGPPPHVLWRSDGTPEGTWVVKEIQADSLTAVGGTLFFAGYDSLTGFELWKSDGTFAGTTIVRDICPGECGGFSLGGQSRAPVALGNQLFFSATDGQTTGLEPWISDGSFDGTHLVRDINPGPSPSDPYGLEPVGSVVYFGANEGSSGPTLWKTDGTYANTVRVSALSPLAQTNLGGVLYFLAETNASSTGLWTSDGTTPGTRLVKDICGSCVISGLTNNRLAAAGGLVYFATRPDESFSFSLWRSDGTEAGTQAIGVEFKGEAVYEGPRELTAVSNRVFFAASDGVSGTELWRSDGTTTGTVMVVDRASHASSPQGLTSVGTKVYFAASEPATGLETWSSDGTPDGTNMITDLHPGSPGSVDGPRVALGAWLLMAGRIGLSGAGTDVGLWRTDGTEDGTTQVLAGVRPREFEVVAGIAYFTAVDFEVNGYGYNRHLWRSDGTPGGTWVVKTWEQSGETPTELTNVDGVLFFRGPDGLWKSDGTTQGTVLVKAVFTAAELTSLGSTLYFRNPYGSPLWRSDGTSAGTYAVRSDLPPLPYHSYQGLVRAASRVYFIWQSPGGGSAELWKSDGTSAGTVPIKPIPGDRLHANGGSGLLFFAPGFGGDGYDLWKSDGTAAGTVLIENLYAISDLVNIDGTLYFAAYDPEHGRELWKSDGTPDGTVLVQDIAPGPASSNPQGFARAGDLVYFNADDGATGAELWAFPVPESAVAAMTSPAPASRLPGATVTFTWAFGAAATEYWLYVGTTFGGGQILNASQGRNLSKIVGGLPLDGRTIYVRLWTLFGGSWRSVDYTYTAAVPRSATMVAPAPGAALGSSVVTFTWEAGAGATAYWLYVGTTPGGKQIYPGSQVTSLSATVGGLPTNGSPVYVRLFSLIGGVWQHNDYTYTSGAPAVVLTVNPTAVQPGQTVQVMLQGGPGNLRDWIGLHALVATDTSYLDWRYLNGAKTIPATPLTTATLTFTMPSAAGTYNFRFFQNGGFAKLATSPTVTVGAVTDPVMTVTPTSLAFGDVAVGTTLDKTVVVTNMGGGTLAGTGSITGTGYSIIGTASYALTANQEMTLTVRFAPAAGGSANGTLTLTGGAGAAVQLAGNGTSAGPSLTLVGGVTTVAPGASVQVQVSNGPGFTKDWVGLHAAAAADTVYLDWKYLSGTRTAPATALTDASLTFTMPTTPGAYQFRFFSNNTFARLATSTIVTVSATTPALTVNATTATPGQAVQVTLTNGPGNTKDWIGLYASDGTNTAYLNWYYLNGTRSAPAVGVTTTTVTFTMPATPGTYEFRFFQNNTYTRFATSPTVTVQ